MHPPQVNVMAVLLELLNGRTKKMDVRFFCCSFVRNIGLNYELWDFLKLKLLNSKFLVSKESKYISSTSGYLTKEEIVLKTFTAISYLQSNETEVGEVHLVEDLSSPTSVHNFKPDIYYL